MRRFKQPLTIAQRAALPVNYPNKFIDFKSQLQKKLDKFLGVMNTQIQLARINDVIREEFSSLEVFGDLLMPADGLRIVGAKAVIDGTSSVSIKWITQFYPRPRYTAPAANYMPLGFFGGFDLYFSNDVGYPYNILAKLGEAGYITYNPLAIGYGDHGELFSEALKRLNLLES